MKNIETKHLINVLNSFHPIKGSESKKQSNEIQRYDISEVLSVLRSNCLNDVKGYFENHRKKSIYTKLDDEYKVQDLLFCNLKSYIPDLHYENPQPKPTGGLTSTRIDFTSKSLELLLEVKFVNSASKAKNIEAEMSEDIVKYGKSCDFSSLIFFIHCNGYSLPNKIGFEKGFTGTHKIHDNNFDTICIVN